MKVLSPATSPDLASGTKRNTAWLVFSLTIFREIWIAGANSKIAIMHSPAQLLEGA